MSADAIVLVTNNFVVRLTLMLSDSDSRSPRETIFADNGIVIPVGKLTDNLVVISGAGHLSELIGFLEQGDMFQPCGEKK